MRGRPAGIWIIAMLEIAMAITLLPGMGASYPGISPIGGWTLTDLGRSIFIVWAVLSVIAALGLWALSRRGWVLTMVLVGASLLANLVLWWIGDPNYLRLAIQVAAALYLNSAPVRRIFMRDDDLPRIEIPEGDAS